MVSGALYSAWVANQPGRDLLPILIKAADDVSLVRGAHQIQFGVNFIRPVQTATINFNSAGGFTFNGSVTGLSMADFLIGAPSSFADANINQDLERHKYVGLYIQDSWKLIPRLTRITDCVGSRISGVTSSTGGCPTSINLCSTRMFIQRFIRMRPRVCCFQATLGLILEAAPAIAS